MLTGAFLLSHCLSNSKVKSLNESEPQETGVRFRAGGCVLGAHQQEWRELDHIQQETEALPRAWGKQRQGGMMLTWIDGLYRTQDPQ